MMTIKAGVAAPITLDTIPDRTDIVPESITLAYVLSGTTNVPTQVTGFASKGQGAYEYMLTINQTGYYTLSVVVPGDGETYEDDVINTTVLVTAADIDDVYEYIGTIEGKIDSIKSQVDLLDEETVNGLNDRITELQTKLNDITALISDENDPAITSLKELLNQLASSVDQSNSALTVIDTYIKAATDDIENMIAGTDTLADGSPNPFKGNTNIDIMQALTSMGVTLQQANSALKTAIETKIDIAKAELAADIEAVQTVVVANQGLLENDVYGLAKIMTTLEAFKSAETNHFTSLTTDVANVSDAISAMHTAVSSKLDTIENKIDVVTGYVKRKQSSRIV